MKKLINKIDNNNLYIKLTILSGILLMLFLIADCASARDLLAGTDTDMKDTMDGTAKHWAYWIDGGISLASFAYTKKPVVFFSVLGICIFITALIKMASGSPGVV